VTISVEREGGRIILRSPYSDRNLEAAKSVPGANFRKVDRVWTYPLSLDHCRALRRAFGRSLQVGSELSAWARAEVSREEELIDLGKRLDGVQLVRLPEIAPRTWAAIASRLYQAVGARFVVSGRSVLVADTPGLGKTLEAIAGIIESGEPGPYLVVAPKTSTSLVWEREITRWDPRASVWVMPEGRSRREAKLAEALDPSWDLSTTWVVINIEMVRTVTWWECRKRHCVEDCELPHEHEESWERWKASDKPRSQIVDCGHDPTKVKVVDVHQFPQLFDVDWGAIVADECQKSLMRRSGTPTNTRNGMRLLRSRGTPEEWLRIALSGSPMRGRPERLWGTLNWLRPDLHTGFWGWVALYWEVFSNGYNGRSIGDFMPETEGAFNRALGRVMIRRTKAEVSPELPPKLYADNRTEDEEETLTPAIWLDMTPDQERAYMEMLRTGSAEVESGTLIGILAELTRLKQFSTCYGEIRWRTIKVQGKEIQEPYFVPTLPSNKFDWLVNFLDERNLLKDSDDRPEGKVIIASQFTEILNLFRARLLDEHGLKSLKITGDVTGRSREEAVDWFNDMGSGYNVMFLNTNAGGVSITLDSADEMVILDETHVPDDQEQLEDRNNNRNPEIKIKQRTYWYLKSLGTVEEAIARTNLVLDQQQKRFLDGRRGVEYMRQVMQEARELAQ
jgi:SNF2 family DNA or RNA helicase